MALGFFTYKGRRYDFSKLSMNFARAKTIFPRFIAQEAENFFKDRFREQGWRDSRLKPWQKRKNNSRGRTGRGILIDSGKLRNAINTIKATFKETIISNDMPYASVHNEGFKGKVNVKAHSRNKSQVLSVSQSSLKTRKTSTRKKRTRTGTVSVRSHSRTMDMPQRQFMGNSDELDREIDRILTREIDKIFD